MTDLIRIFIADDHAIVREGLRALLATEPGLELVGEANDGLQAVSKVRDLRPDVMLIDMLMPRMDGLEAILEIRKDWPEAKIIVITRLLHLKN
jgi:DNA-binding NarL/FixJ family response regulator